MLYGDHLDVLHDSATLLGERAAKAGLGTRVRTVPNWRVRNLVAHTGMVHRWATGHLLAEEDDTPTEAEFLRSLPDDALLEWYENGWLSLLRTLERTDEDVATYVFLNDAPKPRDFWARRQAHETTVHAIDALSAELGRYPAAGELAVARELAEDGIDELLTGFVTRGRVRMPAGAAGTVSVQPADSPRGWTMRIDGDAVRTSRVRTPEADVVLEGTAAALYAGLWNRCEQIAESGRGGFLPIWRAHEQVIWSS